MSDYTPPEIWKPDNSDDGEFSKINRPISGATHERDLPVGNHPFQLYSLATPNGVKVTIMFEELLEKGHKDAEYDAFFIDILEGQQFSSGFVDINPNSKIPAMVDNTVGTPIRIFESGSILFYLAQKFNEFLPSAIDKKTETLNWLFWQVGSAPYLGGGFGHFYNYAPQKIKYCIDRFTMETKRQLDVLDKQLGKNEFISGNEYTIADIAIWPWYGELVRDNVYSAATFLEAENYSNLKRWADQVANRPAVKRGKIVNKSRGDEDQQLRERHSSDDFKNLKL